MSKIMYNDRAYGEIIEGGASILPFIGTDGTNPGVTGLVPAPSALEAGMFLKSDGTWAIPGSSSGVASYNNIILLIDDSQAAGTVDGDLYNALVTAGQID